MLAVKWLDFPLKAISTTKPQAQMCPIFPNNSHAYGLCQPLLTCCKLTGVAHDGRSGVRGMRGNTTLIRSGPGVRGKRSPNDKRASRLAARGTGTASRSWTGTTGITCPRLKRTLRSPSCGLMSGYGPHLDSQVAVLFQSLLLVVGVKCMEQQ